MNVQSEATEEAQNPSSNISFDDYINRRSQEISEPEAEAAEPEDESWEETEESLEPEAVSDELDESDEEVEEEEGEEDHVTRNKFAAQPNRTPEQWHRRVQPEQGSRDLNCLQ